MNTIYDLANWFLFKSSMSHKKLQKLCYYAVAWHYALYDSPLVKNDEFEAWIHGPVSPSLWHEYKDYVWGSIPQSKTQPDLGNDMEEYLEIVLNTYDEFSGHQLESLTHDELPWIEARRGLEDYQASKNKINPMIMKQFYRSIYDTSQND
ncbi:MAG: DUF4065 domain-containing protein [Methanosarcinales archaeon]|nr:MAG: DUF4065 domain-containing protein [Methanosarcinales archaeon]